MFTLRLTELHAPLLVAALKGRMPSRAGPAGTAVAFRPSPGNRFLNTASFPRLSPKEWALPFPSRGVAPERGFPCRKATAPLCAAACRFISCTGSGFSSHEGRVLPPSFDPVESYSFSARWAGCSPPEPSRKISPAAHTVMAFAAWSGSFGPIFLRGHRSERSANRRNRSARSAHTEETL